LSWKNSSSSPVSSSNEGPGWIEKPSEETKGTWKGPLQLSLQDSRKSIPLEFFQAMRPLERKGSWTEGSTRVVDKRPVDWHYEQQLQRNQLELKQSHQPSWPLPEASVGAAELLPTVTAAVESFVETLVERN